MSLREYSGSAIQEVIDNRCLVFYRHAGEEMRRDERKTMST